MTDSPVAADLLLLADELHTIVAAIPGVSRLQPRPGIARLARRVVDEVQTKFGSGSSAVASPIGLTVSGGATIVDVDVAVERDHVGPVVARAIAAAILDRLALAGLPSPRVDVRIVAIG